MSEPPQQKKPGYSATPVVSAATFLNIVYLEFVVSRNAMWQRHCHACMPCGRNDSLV